MQLLLPGASDDQAAVGVEAARIFLLSHGLVAEEAAAAFAFVEACDDAGALDEERPSAEIIHAARAWSEAQVLAVSAASPDWPFDARIGELHP